MRFGIVSDRYKDPEFKILNRLTSYLLELGADVVIPDTRHKGRRDKSGLPAVSWDDVDLAISIGGDGTFLYTCHEVYPLGIPLIGINLGQMGFMTEIEYEDAEQALARLVKGDYRVKTRMMLEVEVADLKTGEVRLKAHALNDVVLYRGNISRIIPCTFSLNGNMIEVIPSDGLIVAGPTGSTGYALACGGPIVHPDLELMLLTPISPHTLHNRSYVVEPNSEIELGIEEGYPFKPMLTIDGQALLEVGSDSAVKVRKAERPIRIAYLEELNFFRRLPNKINARGRAR